MRKLLPTLIVLLTLAIPASACAASLPFLTEGNARYTLEKRFQKNEERYGEEAYSLANCYRVSRTHVNCYAEVNTTAYSCEVTLWRVYETASARELARRKYTMHTQGQYWQTCEQ